MPRNARIVAVGVPQHITVRGNRRQDVFFTDQDRVRYLEWLCEYSERYQFQVYAYCLMTNHVHIIGNPLNESGMGNMMRILGVRHSQHINKSQGWSGHLWQNRYFSTMLDEAHLHKAVRYVEQNPVRAKMISQAVDYPWSTASAHCGLSINPLIKGDRAWSGELDDWPRLLKENVDEEALREMRECTNSGKPSGDEDFVARISTLVGKRIERRPRGRPRLNTEAGG